MFNSRVAAKMGMFAETANVDYCLPFANQGKQCT
jgi:hypothetical protein